MSTCARGVKIAQRLTSRSVIPIAELPAFLCPGILRVAPRLRQASKCPPKLRQSHTQTSSSKVLEAAELRPDAEYQQRTLPAQCAGCGALTQTVVKDEPGFYTTTRKTVREYISGTDPQHITIEDAIVKAALENAGDVGKELGMFPPKPQKSTEPPVCDRCHLLKHHDTGVSIHHPSVQSIQDTIFESPHKYNHVYHVLDAADFPMSLVPGLHKLLNLTPQRSLNRRSKSGKFYHGRKTEVSFIITRSDLLAPMKEQVDHMMPYLREVLRDALGRTGKDVRLGNIRCVSARQGWWTKELKEEIWKRGGGGWMVGKVNVGKSQLFSDVFPKGRRRLAEEERQVEEKFRPRPVSREQDSSAVLAEQLKDLQNKELQEQQTKFDQPLDASSLLPPLPPEVDYPSMPLVSALPGTTASPIRHAFGNGKGELIDLPGLSRSDLELHVQPQHRSSLVLRTRVRPEQQVMRPGQSLLLGGFIRITPTTPDLIMMSYAFTSMEAHLTSTIKAIGTQEQTRESAVENISLEGTGEKIRSAGVFPLKWDVTKERSGPLTRKDGVGLSPDRLPYRVLATDILVEGCGWVEIVAQVRRKYGSVPSPEKPQQDFRWEEKPGFGSEEAPKQKKVEQPKPAPEAMDTSWPAVEVFTPEGKFVAQRQPMNAWLLSRKPVSSRARGRPRKSMKGHKKAEKKRRRALL